ncbi:hypothetical protein B0H13DRAFT_1533488, partial [Mycena leptocephala]
YYGTNATAFNSFLVDYHETSSRNIWVTEWACQNMGGSESQCSMDDVENFMQSTQGFV